LKEEPLETAARSTTVSIARQPIFDEKRRLWGYELFCVGSAETMNPGSPEESSVAINVQSSAYVCLQQLTNSGKKIVVDFTEKSILADFPHALPPTVAAVKVEERVCKIPSVMESLGNLKSDGYLIAVDDFSGKPACAPLYCLADILSIEVGTGEKEGLVAGIAAARQYPAALMAKRVQDQRQFKICQEIGFSFFHGAFFKSPDQMTVRKLSSNEVVRFNLLQLIEKDEPDFGRLAEMISSDATVSLRLLAYLNSAAFALSQTIKSIPQAIALLGWRNVKTWLRVVLLTDMSQNKHAHELVLLSAQRGLFLELVARDHDFWGFAPESMHLIGIFSLLDTLLQVPMSEIVDKLPLDNKMKGALCRQPNNEYSPMLQLAQLLEEARWADSEWLIQQLNLDSRKVKAAFQTSLDWAGELESLHSIQTFL
jgi:EAL and modified HD-GYP domain-containing signal transduction protein